MLAEYTSTCSYILFLPADGGTGSMWSETTWLRFDTPAQDCNLGSLSRETEALATAPLRPQQAATAAATTQQLLQKQ